MRKIIVKILVISFFMAILLLPTKDVKAATLKGYTDKKGNTYIVPYGKTITIVLENNENVTSDNEEKCIIDENRIKIVGTGKFTITVNKDEKEEKINFFGWNAKLKAGKYYVYKDVDRKKKIGIVDAKVYFAVSETRNKKTFKINEHIFTSGSSKSNIDGKYITSYYNKKKNKSTKKAYYTYSMVEKTETNGEDTKSDNVSKGVKADVDIGYTYPVSGKVIKSYKDETIVVSVELIDDFYVSKIWVKNPSTQVRKKQSSETTLKRTRTVNEILNSTPNAIIGCNGSSYSRSLEGNIDKPNGTIIITNGVIKRQWANKNAEVILGMLQDGSFKYYRNSPYSELINDGVKNTFKFGPILINDGVASSSSEPHQRPNAKADRCCIGQIDAHNYVILSTKATAKTGAAQKLGLKLGCKLLYNADGGGSTTLWFRAKKTGKGTQIKSSGRKLPDTLYFVTEKN